MKPVLVIPLSAIAVLVAYALYVYRTSDEKKTPRWSIAFIVLYLSALPILAQMNIKLLRTI